jgi:hypothetical protein
MSWLGFFTRKRAVLSEGRGHHWWIYSWKRIAAHRKEFREEFSSLSTCQGALAATRSESMHSSGACFTNPLTHSDAEYNA